MDRLLQFTELQSVVSNVIESVAGWVNP